LKPDWSAAYNNLGVARFNKDLLDGGRSALAGLGDIERAIEIANADGDDTIALLAYVNQSKLLGLTGNLVDAQASCEAARSLDAQAAFPYVCLASIGFLARSSPDTGPGLTVDESLADIGKYLDQAEQSDDIPAFTHYLRATWHMDQHQNQEAVAAFSRFSTTMQYRACLQLDRMRIENAAYFMSRLGR
jgi:hypothetical protein